MNRYPVSQLAKQYVVHDMIQAHTELPAFPSVRAELLCLFLKRNQRVKKESELFSLITALVQLGLDTHDMVEVDTDDRRERNLRSQQLKVLAGDYFSSQFYHLLAQADQIDVIRILSKAVCEINSLKMKMIDDRQRYLVTAQQYLQTAIELKMLLFQSFQELIQQEDIYIWEQLLAFIAELEVLQQEQMRTKQFTYFADSWSYWYIWQFGTTEERKIFTDHTYDVEKWKSLLSHYKVYDQLAEQVRTVIDKLQCCVRVQQDERLRTQLMCLLEFVF